MYGCMLFESISESKYYMCYFQEHKVIEVPASDQEIYSYLNKAMKSVYRPLASIS